jgi:uncharacterized SAM-binding protein YcdF (DUF218 family)
MSVIIKLLLLLLTPFILALSFVLLTPQILSIDDLKGCAGPDQTERMCQPADVIVAISGGDTDARAQEAIKLYQAGWAPKIIFSGAAEDKQGASNAAAMAQLASSARIPSDAILLDEVSINTADNASHVRELVQQSGFKRLILVTSPYHQRRASIEFQRRMGDITTIVNHPTATDRFWSGDATWWTTPWGLWTGVSEIVKVLFVSVSHG